MAAAVAGMSWLTETDAATVALALDLAGRLDRADDDKAAGYLAQLLLPVLRSLGGTPGDRKSLGVEQQVRGRLAELRAAR